MFNSPFSLSNFYNQGYHKTSLSGAASDRLLDAVKKEHMVNLTTEVRHDGSANRHYTNRMISKRSLFQPLHRQDDYQQILELVHEYLSPLFKTCNIAPALHQHGLSVFLGLPGYSMEDHVDVGDQALAICMIYLSNDEFNQETGGELSLSRVHYSNDLDVIKRQHVESIYPNHGTVVIINAKDPRFQHGVRPLLSKDKLRYSLFMPIYSSQLATWDVPFESNFSGIDTDSCYSFQQFTDID